MEKKQKMMIILDKRENNPTPGRTRYLLDIF